MRQVPWNVYAFMDFAKFTGCLVRLQDRNANYMDTPSSASNMYGYTTTRQDPVNVYFHYRRENDYFLCPVYHYRRPSKIPWTSSSSS